MYVFLSASGQVSRTNDLLVFFPRSFQLFQCLTTDSQTKPLHFRLMVDIRPFAHGSGNIASTDSDISEQHLRMPFLF